MEYTSPEDLREATRQAKTVLRGDTVTSSSNSSPSSKEKEEPITYPSALDPQVSKLLQSGKAKTVSEARAIIGYEKAGFTVDRIGDKLIAYPKGTALMSTEKGVVAVPTQQPDPKQSGYTFGQPQPDSPYGQPTTPAQREPSFKVEVGSQISQSSVSKLAEKYHIEAKDIGIGITESEEGSKFSILFFNEMSYDPSMVLEEYKQLESMEILRSQELAKKQTSGYLLLKHSEEAMRRGDIFGTMVYAIGGKFTPEDPMGLKTIGIVAEGFVKGRPLQDISQKVQAINQKSFEYIAGRFGVTKDKPPTFLSMDTVENIKQFTLESPIGQAGIAGVGGYIIGGAISSLAIPIITSPIGEGSLVHDLTSRVSGFVMKHPKAITYAFYGIGGQQEIKKIYEMRKAGEPIENILAKSGSSMVKMVAFGEGFASGLQKGIPLKYTRVTIGDETLYSGFTLEYGRKAQPLLARTPEGIKIGTPKFSEETLEKFYGESLRSKAGYIPMTPTETKLAYENVVKGYATSEQDIIGKSIKLREMTYGTKSAFLEKELPLEDVFERHKLRPETRMKLRELFKAEDDILIYGSTGQKAQSKGFKFRDIHDLDIQVKDAESLSDKVMKILKSTEKQKFTQEGSLISSKTGHLFDIHDATTSEIGSGSMFDTYIGHGFKGEPEIIIGGLKTHQLSEQATRKMTSTLTLREEGVFPQSHRVKDVADYFQAEDILIKSQEKGMISGLNVGKITAEKSVLLDLEKGWIDKASKLPPLQQKEFFNKLEQQGIKIPTHDTKTIVHKKGFKPEIPSGTLNINVDVSSLATSNLIKKYQVPSGKDTPSSASVEIRSSMKSPSFSSPSMKDLSSPASMVRSPSSPSPSPYRSPSLSPSISPSPSPSPSVSASLSPSLSPSISPSPSPSPSPSVSLPPSPSPSLPPPPSLFSSKDKRKIKGLDLHRTPRLQLGYAPDLGSILVGRMAKIPKIKLAGKTFSGLEKRGIAL